MKQHIEKLPLESADRNWDMANVKDMLYPLIDAVNLLTGEEQCFAEGKTNSGHPTVCLARKPCPEHDKSSQEPPKDTEIRLNPEGKFETQEAEPPKEKEWKYSKDCNEGNCSDCKLKWDNCLCGCHVGIQDSKPELNVEVLLEEYRHLRYDSVADHRRKQQIIATLKANLR